MALFLNGCSIFDDEEDEEDVEIIAPLPVIQKQFEPKVLWQQSVGKGVSHYYSRLSPAVHKGIVYAASRDGQVSAFELESGKRVWNTNLGESNSLWSFEAAKSARLAGGVTVAYGNVFIGTENGEMFSLDGKTGELRWKVQVKGEVIAPATYGEGLLFVNTAAGYLVALHPDTGEQRWSVEQEIAPLTLRGTSTPIYSGGGVLVGTATGKMMVVIAAQGVTAWEQPIANSKGATDLERLIDSDSKPIIIGGNIYTIAFNGNLVAMEMRSGRVVWKREYSSFSNLTHKNDTLFVTDTQGHVYAIDAQSGIERWSQTALFNRSVTAPAVVDDFVLVGDFEGYVHILSQESGEFVSRIELDSSGVFAAPSSASNTVIVYTRDGEVSALTLQ